MDKDTKLLNLMIEHHTLIEAYLQVVEDNLNKNGQDALMAFENFKWQLEKHFFLEENSIFASYHSGNPRVNSLINQVVKEHKEISALVTKLDDDLYQNKTVATADLREKLANHRTLEEKELYPILDEEFNPYQKEAIIKKINDIILQSTY